MKVAVTGAHGLVGTALCQALEHQGHKVIRLVRKSKGLSDEVLWSVEAKQLPLEPLEGLDAVVHLAGESLFGYWTGAKKQRILDSRVQGTRLLCETLAGLEKPPSVLISTSAIGYYGNRGDEDLREESAKGDLFVSDVCEQWEQATQLADAAGIRVVNARFSVVLSEKGGALKTMLPPFKLGLGGPLGDGKQQFSWIHLGDLVKAIQFCIDTESIKGPVNMTAPEPLTNSAYTKALGSVLNKPTVLPAPYLAVRLLMGQMADELLFASTRVYPGVLNEAGFEFDYPEVSAALKDLLG